MNRLKKRRPSSPTRPSFDSRVHSASSTNSTAGSNRSPSHGGFSPGTTNPAGSSPPRMMLTPLDIPRNDFRGSVILGSLSKRFSVLRFDGNEYQQPYSATTTSPLTSPPSSVSSPSFGVASPPSSTLPNLTTPTGPPWPSVSVANVKARFAEQRRRGGEAIIKEEEEDQVLEELMGLTMFGRMEGQRADVAISKPTSLNTEADVPDFRKSPSEWGREMGGFSSLNLVTGNGNTKNGRFGGGIGMSRSPSSPVTGGFPMGISDSSTTSNGRSSLPTSQSHPSLSTMANLNDEDDNQSPGPGGKSYGLGTSGNWRDERMMILAMQKKGRKRTGTVTSAGGGVTREGRDTSTSVMSTEDGDDSGQSPATAGTESKPSSTQYTLPSTSPPTSLRYLQPFDTVTGKKSKRTSYIAGLGARDVRRISRAIWEVEDEILHQYVQEGKGQEGSEVFGIGQGDRELRKGSTETIVPRVIPSSVSTSTSDGDESGKPFSPITPIDQNTTPPAKLKRFKSQRKPSINRSPAFHENLAAIVETHKDEEVHVEGVGEGVADLARDDSGKFIKNGLAGVTRVEDGVEQQETLGGEPSPPGRGMSFTRGPPGSFASDGTTGHSRSSSASAVPISKISIQEGYTPGQPRPFTPDRDVFGFPELDVVGQPGYRPTHKKSSSAGLTIRPPVSAVGGMQLTSSSSGSAFLSSRSFSGGIPSVSPVVESFEGNMGNEDGQVLTMPLYSAGTPSTSDPYDTSFDASAYYGTPIDQADVPLMSQAEERESKISVASSFKPDVDEDDTIRQLFGLPLTQQDGEDIERSAMTKVDYDALANEALIPLADMREMQERLVIAAKEVRQAMLGNAPKGQVHPGTLRHKPSVRARKVEMSVYDEESNVSQLGRAMSPHFPQTQNRFSGVDNVDNSTLQRALTTSSTASSQFVSASSSVNDADASAVLSSSQDKPIPKSPVGDTQLTPRRNDIGFGGPRITPTHERQLSQFGQSSDAKARLADALFGPDNRDQPPPSPVSNDFTTSQTYARTPAHQRNQSTASNASGRLDQDPDVVRDYQARIAKATAALQRNNSAPLLKRGSSKRNQAKIIGSPTLVESSNLINGKSLASPQFVQNLWEAPPRPTRQEHKRTKSEKSNQSKFPGQPASSNPNSSVQVDTPASSSSTKGFKGFMSKLKRKDSKSTASSNLQSRQASTPPVIPFSTATTKAFPQNPPSSFSHFSISDDGGPDTSLGRRPSKASKVSNALAKTPSLRRKPNGASNNSLGSSGGEVGLGVQGFDMIPSSTLTVTAAETSLGSRPPPSSFPSQLSNVNASDGEPHTVKSQKNEIVRRTIIFSTSDPNLAKKALHHSDSNPSLLGIPESKTNGGERERKISIRRKPVPSPNPDELDASKSGGATGLVSEVNVAMQNKMITLHPSTPTINDLDIERDATPKAHSGFDISKERQTVLDSRRSRTSTVGDGEGSLLDDYYGADGGDESDTNGIAYDEQGMNGEQAVEFREMSNGTVTWSVIDPLQARQSLLQPTPSLISNTYSSGGNMMMRKSSTGTTGTGNTGDDGTDGSLYSQEERLADEDEGRIAETGGYGQQGGLRPATQVFYSDPDKVADLIESLGSSGHQGKFKIIPTMPSEAGTSGDSAQQTANEKNANKVGGFLAQAKQWQSGSGGNDNVEDRLQALMKRMKSQSRPAGPDSR